MKKETTLLKNVLRLLVFPVFVNAIFAVYLEAAKPPAVTVEIGMGNTGTGAELIVCPMVGKTPIDTNWIYQMLPNGFPNPSFPPTTGIVDPPLPPSPRAASDLSQTWSSWDICQNVTASCTDNKVTMDKVLFDPSVPNASGVIATGVVIYLDMQDLTCIHQVSYLNYLASKKVAFTKVDRDTVPNYKEFVGRMNYLSPGNSWVPLLLINGEPVVGRWGDRTQARIDSLLAKAGITTFP
ncbi:MAG: hypothetical protein WA705_30415 [Candidatus Ozemobacteraceae bacterium]